MSNGSTTPPQGTSTPARGPSRQDSSDTETPRRGSDRREPPASPSHSGERSDVESDAEHSHSGTPATPRLEMASKEELIALYRKQDRVLTRYKTRFSEVCT